MYEATSSGLRLCGETEILTVAVGLIIARMGLCLPLRDDVLLGPQEMPTLSYFTW